MQVKPLEKFRLLAADLSLRRPSFAILLVDPQAQRIEVTELLDVDNRLYGFPRGYLFQRLADMIASLSGEADVFVREGAWMSPQAEKSIFMVAGIAELALWQSRKANFYEIYPAQVKELITGNSRATKDEVAGSLRRFIGPRDYACDGHSDAIAVGIAWLKLTGILTEKDGGYQIHRMIPRPSQNVHGAVMELFSNIGAEVTTCGYF